MGISEADIKKLWGLAAGKCSFPNCSTDCIQFVNPADPVLVGEMAHVIAQSPKGPRGEPSGGSDSYENLILLCPTHHRLIDKAPEGTYSADQLLEWKNQHETRVINSLSAPVFSNKGALYSRILRLLIENKATWRTYGPESEIAKKDPMSNVSRFWVLRKLAQIIPNNRRIINLIEQHKDLLAPQEYEVCREFVEHAEGFEASTYDRKDSIPRFPSSFEELVRNGATTQ